MLRKFCWLTLTLTLSLSLVRAEDVEVVGIRPQRDLTPLGSEGRRWSAVYTLVITDGEGNAAEVSRLADIAARVNPDAIAPIESPEFVGSPSAPTPEAEDNSPPYCHHRICSRRP